MKKVKKSLPWYFVVVFSLLIISPLVYYFLFIFKLDLTTNTQLIYDDSSLSSEREYNVLTKLPINNIGINLTDSQKASLLQNSFSIENKRYYRNFSSYYYDLVQSQYPVQITSDSVLNYAYAQLAVIKKDIIEETLIPRFNQWLDSGIRYFENLKNSTKDANVSSNCEMNINNFNQAKVTLSSSKELSRYSDAYQALNDAYASPDALELKQQIKAFNNIDNTASYYSIVAINKLLGISNESIDLDGKSEEFSEDFSSEDLSYYDQAFSRIEGSWADNEKISYRGEIIGEISSLPVQDPRWASVNSLTNQVTVESDKPTYDRLTKYFEEIDKNLSNQTISPNALSSIKNAKDVMVALNNCSNNTCDKNMILNFLKNAGGVEDPLYVTEGIFANTNLLSKGPIFTQIPEDTTISNNKVLGVTTYASFKSKYDYTVRKQPSGTVRIPVLMYHNIAPMPVRASKYVKGLYVTPSMFDAQMAYLKQKKYKTVTSEEFYNQLQSGKNPDIKMVMLTFDDGSRGQYTQAYPILKKYGLTGVFYFTSDTSPIKASEMKKMANDGMIIDSHSATHKDLRKMNDPKKLAAEITKSKAKLEKVTGKTIFSIAYPGCVADKESWNVVKAAGYKLGFSCGTVIDHRYKDKLYLSRIHAFSDMYTFKKALSWGL